MVKGNFSNSRLAPIEFRRRVSASQHAVMVYQLCRSVWSRWMDATLLSGALSLPGYEAERTRLQAADWLPTKWDWVDPLKDANAEIAQVEAGLKSRTQAIAERGYDAEQVDREIAAEHARERMLGLDFRRPGLPAQGVRDGPGVPPAPVDGSDEEQEAPDEDEDTDDDWNREDQVASRRTPGNCAALRSKVTSSLAPACRAAAAIMRSAKSNPSLR